MLKKIKSSEKIKVSAEIMRKLEDFMGYLQEELKQDVNWDDLFAFFINEHEVNKNKLKKVLTPPHKIDLPNSNLNQNSLSSSGMHDPSLGIPPAPKKKPIQVDINKKDMQLLAKKETKDTKFILIECRFCGTKPIIMPVPKKLVLEAAEPVVDISYVHGNPEHVIVAQLDHDFQVRRRRVSRVVYEKNYIS